MMRRAIVTVAALVLVACAGAKAREALLPTIRQMWHSIRPDVVRNIYPLPEAEEQQWRDRILVADTALRIGIKGDIADVDWRALTDQAEAQIRKDLERGDLVPATADRLLLRIEVFHEMIAKHLEVR